MTGFAELFAILRQTVTSKGETAGGFETPPLRVVVW